jgi:hypothetical protein
MDWFACCMGLAGFVVGFVLCGVGFAIQNKDNVERGFFEHDGIVYRITPVQWRR